MRNSISESTSIFLGVVTNRSMLILCAAACWDGWLPNGKLVLATDSLRSRPEIIKLKVMPYKVIMSQYRLARIRIKLTII